MIDISDVVTPRFFEEVNKFDVIGFEKDGITTHYKIVRLNRTTKTCKVEPVKLYTEDDINNMSRSEAEEIIAGKADAKA